MAVYIQSDFTQKIYANFIFNLSLMHDKEKNDATAYKWKV